jgi:sec-independent protein translocase protein TatA
MWRPGVPEILIVLVIVLLLFGPGRIANIARELGNSITAFREGMGDKKQEKDETVENKPTENKS